MKKVEFAVDRLQEILNGNPGLQRMKEIPCNYKYAPLTSCDVERSFSVDKTIYQDNRRGFVAYFSDEEPRHVKGHYFLYFIMFGSPQGRYILIF